MHARAHIYTHTHTHTHTHTFALSLSLQFLKHHNDCFIVDESQTISLVQSPMVGEGDKSGGVISEEAQLRTSDGDQGRGGGGGGRGGGGGGGEGVTEEMLEEVKLLPAEESHADERSVPQNLISEKV